MTMDATGGARGDAPQSAAEVWALFKETDRIVKEIGRKQEETDRMLKEFARQQKKAEREMRESSRRVDKQIGELGGSFGRMVEHLVSPGIKEKFKALGYAFDKTCTNMEFTDDTGRTIAEVDLWQEDGDYVMAVEVKASLSAEDVREHIARLRKIRERFDAKGDGRKILGAAAGAVFEGNVKAYAVRQGLYVLCQTGDTVRIEVPEGFRPCTW